VIGLSLATVASGFAQTTVQFVALQMISRTFMVTCAAAAFVIITEELPKQHRGWGIGILGALGSFGHGLGLLLFAAIDVLPYGWRAMYVVGMMPLLLLPRFRRQVSETGRFRRAQAARGGGWGWAAGWWDPLARLLRSHPQRALVVGLIGALASAGHSAGFSFAAYFVQTDHGWAPGQFTAMAMVAGMAGIIGHPFAGRFADRRGRRPVGFLLFAAYPLLAVAFYHGPGWALPFLWVPLIFTLTGGITIARALSTELFPTSHRGTSAGWLQLTDAFGAAGGLFLVSWGTAAGSSNTPMISWVVFATLGAGLLVLMLPESGRRELEDISAAGVERSARGGRSGAEPACLSPGIATRAWNGRSGPSTGCGCWPSCPTASRAPGRSGKPPTGWSPGSATSGWTRSSCRPFPRGRGPGGCWLFTWDWARSPAVWAVGSEPCSRSRSRGRSGVSCAPVRPA
jgi:MFS family permease